MEAELEARPPIVAEKLEGRSCTGQRLASASLRSTLALFPGKSCHTVPRSRTPVWERWFPKLCFAAPTRNGVSRRRVPKQEFGNQGNSVSRPAHETELSGGGFPNRTLGTRELTLIRLPARPGYPRFDVIRSVTR